MSDDELIRRGDVLAALQLGDTMAKLQARVCAIPAAPVPQDKFSAVDHMSRVADTWMHKAEGLQREIDMLTDPVTVHTNMLRGTIAKPTVDQIIHLYGVDALVKALAPVIVREADAPAASPLPADVAGLVERILSMPHRMDCGLLGGYDGGCTCGHDQAVADAEAQARQIVDLTARVEAERERAEDQAALVTCGCAYDKPTDLCMAHKRILDRLRAADIARAEKAEAENARLRELVRRIPNALNQAFAAGMEEREHGSARRQAKCLEVVDALRADARAAEKGGDNG